MKKIDKIKSHIKMSVIVYLTFWFIICFGKWEIINPFQWVIDLPTYKDSDRLGILFSIPLYHFFIWFLRILTKENKK